jgi:uncharacterized RDD family membrane protein YckC
VNYASPRAAASARRGERERAIAAPAAGEAAEPVRYVGLITRALAFGVDCAIVDLAAIATSAIVALTFSVLELPDALQTAVIACGAVAFIVWSVGYFVVFWSTTGQTPGCRLMRIRVVPATGTRLPPRRAIVRFVGLILAALPLFAGFLLILVDNRRRGLQDVLARTVVVDADREAR